MKKTLFAFITASILIACNNETSADSDKGKAENLKNEVLKSHNEGMGPWMKIETVKKGIQHLLDSLNILPEKTNAGVAAMKEKLSSAITDLQSAYDGMDKWMPTLDFNYAKDNVTERIKYFTEQKLKAKQVNDAIFISLAKADSLLKSKF